MAYIYDMSYFIDYYFIVPPPPRGGGGTTPGLAPRGRVVPFGNYLYKITYK